VVDQHAAVLALHHGPHVRGQRLVQGPLVVLLGHVLAALALVEHSQCVLAGNGRFDVDPAAVHGAAQGGFLLGISAQIAHQLLKFRRRRGTGSGTLGEHCLRSGRSTSSAQTLKPSSPSLLVSIRSLRMATVSLLWLAMTQSPSANDEGTLVVTTDRG